MTNVRLLGVAKVRRTLIVPIVVYTVLNAISNIPGFGADWRWMTPAYLAFDCSLWVGVTLFIFAVIERRQKLPPQPRLLAMAMATVSIAALAMTLISLRALFGSIVTPRPFVTVWLNYLPAPFYAATFYVAIVTGIGYAVHSWAVDDRRLAEAAELDAAIARAELKAAAGRLRPEYLDAALARLSTVMATSPAAAQELISDLGALLHDSLAHPGAEPDYPSVTTRLDSDRFAGSVRFAPLASIERYDCAR